MIPSTKLNLIKKGLFIRLFHYIDISNMILYDTDVIAQRVVDG